METDIATRNSSREKQTFTLIINMEQITNSSIKDDLVNIKEIIPTSEKSEHVNQQILEFLKPDQLDHLNSLTSSSEKAQFIFKNEGLHVGSYFGE